MGFAKANSCFKYVIYHIRIDSRCKLFAHMYLNFDAHLKTNDKLCAVSLRQRIAAPKAPKTFNFTFS